MGAIEAAGGRWLPLRNHLHAKVIFRDTLTKVPRHAPMMICADELNIWPLPEAVEVS